MPNLKRALFAGLRGPQHEPATTTGLSDGRAGGDAEWPQHVASSGMRMQPVPALLGVALVAVLGVWGGAELQKRQGDITNGGTSAFSGSFAGRTAGATGQGNFTGAPGAAPSVASGTVTSVTRKTLYLTSSTGALVTVKLTAKTTFTRTAKSAATGLKLGDTATVQGTKNAAGVAVATSVTATAKGVTAPTRGFSGGSGVGPGTSPAAG
jgi:hypothetical protein